MNEIVLRPASMPLPVDLAQEFGVTANDWRVLVDQLYPAAKSSEAIAMAMSYCKARNLDIFKRPVHIVPMYSSALKKMVETVWPGIAEIRTTASRTGEYAGIDAVEFGPMVEREFFGERDKWDNGRKVGVEKFSKKVRFPEWASVVVYRWVKGEKAAFHAKIYWEETYASTGKTEVPNEMWAKRTRGQLDKCVEAAALRKAFPEELGNTYAAEEMEGRTIDGAVVDHEPSTRDQSKSTPPKPSAPPKAPAPTHSSSRGNDEDIVDAEVVDPSVGQATDGNAEDETVIDEVADKALDFLTRLDTALANCTTADDIVEVWNEMDPLASLEGNDDAQAAAKSYKRKHTDRVSKAK